LSSNYIHFTYLEDLKIAIGANNPGCNAAVYWACAQQTGIRNVSIDGGNAAYAIETDLEGGGGLFDGLSVSNSVQGLVSNLTSQMTVRNCTFNCPVTINNYYLSCWAFIGCNFNNPSGFTTNSPIAVSLLDCQFLNKSPFRNNGPVHLEQIQFARKTAAPSAMRANTSSTGLLGQYTSGNVVLNNATVSGSAVGPTNSTIFSRSASIAYPRPSSACVNIQALGAKGDGITDDTAVIQNALNSYSLFHTISRHELCGQRSVPEIAAELARKLKLGLETKPPEEQMAAAKAWLAERRALLVLDDIWETDVEALVPGPPVSFAMHVAPACACVDFAGSFGGSEKLLARRGGVDFPKVPRR
jgi:hypothetical protein